MLHVSGDYWDVGDVEGGGVRRSSDACDAMRCDGSGAGEGAGGDGGGGNEQMSEGAAGAAGVV